MQLCGALAGNAVCTAFLRSRARSRGFSKCGHWARAEPQALDQEMTTMECYVLDISLEKPRSVFLTWTANRPGNGDRERARGARCVCLDPCRCQLGRLKL
jgi:hypothetical protein